MVVEDLVGEDGFVSTVRMLGDGAMTMFSHWSSASAGRGRLLHVGVDVVWSVEVDMIVH